MIVFILHAVTKYIKLSFWITEYEILYNFSLILFNPFSTHYCNTIIMEFPVLVLVTRS